MSEVQRKVYKGVLMRDIDTINGTSAGRTAILNIVMQLRKCCNHPYLFPNTEDRNLDPMGEHLVENCGKVMDREIGKGVKRGRWKLSRDCRFCCGHINTPSAYWSTQRFGFLFENPPSSASALSVFNFARHLLLDRESMPG